MGLRSPPAFGLKAPDALVDALRVATMAGHIPDAVHASSAIGRVLAEDGAPPASIASWMQRLPSLGVNAAALDACVAAMLEGYVTGCLDALEARYECALVPSHTIVGVDADTVTLALPFAPPEAVEWGDRLAAKLARSGVRTLRANVPLSVFVALAQACATVGIRVEDASAGAAQRLGLPARSDGPAAS